MLGVVIGVASVIVDGAIGVAVGAGTSVILRQSFGWEMALDTSAIALAFAFSVAGPHSRPTLPLADQQP